MEESQFNAQAYLEANPDVAASGLDPWTHYDVFGRNENRALSAPAANPTQFNAQAYLAANPDVAAAGLDPLFHYTMYGQNEGRQADFTYDADAAKYAEQLANANAQTELNKYQFSNAGNESAKDIIALKTSNPDLFYKKMADSISNQMFTNYTGNRSGYNAQLEPILESIKTESPSAYYTAKLDLLGRQEGWQHGQNTFGNAAGQQAEVNALAPEALKAGLTSDQINSLVGTGFSEASTANQQRIANLPSAGSFWRDNLIGTGKVAAMALGAYGIDSALGAAAEAASAGGYGLTAANIPAISPELALEGTTLAGAAPSTFGSIVAPSLAGGLGVGSGGVLGGGALSAETIATMEALNAGAGWGLNASQVPNLAAGLELGSIPTSSLSSLLSKAGDVFKGAQLAKGLLGAGKNPLQAQAVGAQPQAQSRQYAGVDYAPILNLLNIQQPQRSKTSLLG